MTKQEAKQKKCRALAGAGVPAQAMPAVNGTRSSGGNNKPAESAESAESKHHNGNSEDDSWSSGID